jgi:hypothetical protein
MTQEKNKCQFLLSFTQLSIWNNNFLGNGFALATCSSAFKAFKHYILPYISYSMNSFCSSWSNNLCASQTCSFSNVNNGCKSVATLALGLRPKQGLARLWAKRRSLGVKGSVREWTLTLPRELHLGSWSPDGLLNVQREITRVKTQWIQEFFIPLESYWNLDA